MTQILQGVSSVQVPTENPHEFISSPTHLILVDLIALITTVS